MKSEVYFVPVAEGESEKQVCDKVSMLVRGSGLASIADENDRVALKLHFGEEGNKGYVRPAYVAVIVDELLRKNTRPFVSDSNTLYRGRRMNSQDHLKLAYEHGFTPEALKAEVLIPDDTQKNNIAEVRIDGSYVKSAKIGRIYADADAIVGIAHFKGHLMTGFGGALKNIGMGCASREGKLFQHSDLAPIVVIKKCTGCKSCVAVCPVAAITMKNGRAVVDSSKCIGCASCIAACKFSSIDLNWEAGGMLIQEKMIEYAKAALLNKKNKSFFVNFLLKITKECDCLAKDDPAVVPDIGILASSDPVALDKASFDLVTAKAGKDIFKELHPKRDANKQLEYAERVGIGVNDYRLQTL